MNALSEKRTKKGFLKNILFGVALLIGVLICVLLIALAKIISHDPLVAEIAEVNTESAVQAKRVAMQLYQDLLNEDLSKEERQRQFTLQLSAQDVNGIVALATRGFPRLKGRVNIAPLAIIGAFTLDIPTTPAGRYVNMTVTVLPSADGLSVYRVSLGDLDIPGDLALAFVEIVLNRFIANESFGTKLINAVDAIEVTHSTLTLKYHPIPNFRQTIISTKQQVKDMRNNMAVFGDPKVIRAYYEHICAFHPKISGIGEAHFGYYLRSVFSLAEKRSHLSELPVEENKAAILALAIFLGSPYFDSVIGALDQNTLNQCQPKKTKVTLANRNDLRLHFIFSAALKLLSDSGLSFAIGEFKELLDTQQGGSGFSYADLAADRAGIRFAEISQRKNDALKVQTMASRFADEQTFFPDITGLPEGISRKEFEKRGGIESDYYKNYLTTINRRIDLLPLYRNLEARF
ncbi:MAG: hypothetical protein CSA50_03890 [Gammaproteobacteria bacterium]|nr:MAG: hypothetical protein CSA50_03890 [Gammaproteobacteria bacterium]